MKNKFIEIFKIALITVFIFFVLDLLIGNYIYKKTLRKNYFDIDTNMGTTHSVYHHGNKKNYKTDSAGWGTLKYSFCTDSNGFRNICGEINKSKNFDIAIIGDSQTEGFGVNYENTFTYLISRKLRNKKIANLAVSSYSPAIYFSKINYLLNKNYKFKEIIVFLDLSDLHDDATKYKLVNDKVISKKIDSGNENYMTKSAFKNEKGLVSVKDKLMFFLSRNLKVTNHIIISTDNFLISKGIKKKLIPYWIENDPRSSWTYSYDKSWYEKKKFEDVLKISLSSMEKLSSLLIKKNIELSVVVFPWPGTIKNDNENNLQLKIWREFCLSKCKNFFDLMKPFFILKKKDGYREVYFKYFIDGDIHLNENGHRLVAENFLKIYK